MPHHRNNIEPIVPLIFSKLMRSSGMVILCRAWAMLGQGAYCFTSYAAPRGF